MLFFIVLAVATSGAWIVGRRSASVRDHARRGLAIAMAVAGVFHLVQPDPFVQHLPDWVAGREALVFLTGLAEIALGAALLGPRAWRSNAGRLLAAYLVAVFPANVYVAVAAVDVDGQPGGPYPWIRLPFQALFVAWALWSTRTEARVPVPAAQSVAGDRDRTPAAAV
jgi:uncharacterized membrane protein